MSRARLAREHLQRRPRRQRLEQSRRRRDADQAVGVRHHRLIPDRQALLAILAPAIFTPVCTVAYPHKTYSNTHIYPTALPPADEAASGGSATALCGSQP